MRKLTSTEPLTMSESATYPRAKRDNLAAAKYEAEASTKPDS